MLWLFYFAGTLQLSIVPLKMALCTESKAFASFFFMYLNCLVQNAPPRYDSLVALHSKYKLMETNLDKVKQNMKEKVPEIERSLELVRHLQERQVT